MIKREKDGEREREKERAGGRWVGHFGVDARCGRGPLLTLRTTIDRLLWPLLFFAYFIAQQQSSAGGGSNGSDPHPPTPD